MLMENFQLDKYLFNIRAFTDSHMIQPLLAGFMLQVIAFLIIFSHFPLLSPSTTSFSHGKLFAHWTKESRDLLKGPRQPVMHLRKRKLEEMEVIRLPFREYLVINTDDGCVYI